MTGYFIESLIMSVAIQFNFQVFPTNQRLQVHNFSCALLSSHEGKQKGEGKRGQSSLFALLLISRK
jgi:hypothetical protein